MNVSEKNLNEGTNVLSLFGTAIERSPAVEIDPLQALLDEAQAEAWEEEQSELTEVVLESSERLLVLESQFPDQSLYVLEKQLKQLGESMSRLKFYLSDLDDLLPR